MQSRTKVINFFGGPGVGKSTTATGTFSWLKEKGYSCEYVSEFAKELTWEGSTGQLENQAHVFAEQFRRQWRLVDKVDYIVTDSPLILSSIYFKYYLDQNSKQNLFTDDFKRLSVKYFDAAFFEFNNINVLIKRAKEYNEGGRNQSLEEAITIDHVIFDRIYNHIDLTTDSVQSKQEVRKFLEENELSRHP